MHGFGMRVRRHMCWAWAALAALAGCELFVADADREVYRLVEKRQRQALGTTTDMRIDGPAASGSDPQRPPRSDPYAFVPSPVENDLPESFERAPTATAPAIIPPEPEGESVTDGESTATAPAQAPGPQEVAASPNARRPATTQPSIEPDRPPPAPIVTAVPDIMPSRPELTLEQALAYAFQHSRDFQSAKEDLYLAALALTLERHLWTPRFFGEVRSLYTDQQVLTAHTRGDPTLEPDRAWESVAEMGVRQRLPYGGEVTANIIHSLVRDVTNHVTDGETGQTVLQANIPLLRGAGPAAFETRYQAERSVVYAIRTFEGFRRNLAVRIADDYFNLQRLRQQIVNTEQSIRSFTQEADRARALWNTGGRRSLLDVQRADQDRLVATNNRVDAIASYLTALDLFKLQIGMPVDNPIDVPFPSEPSTDSAEAGFGAQDSLQAALRMPAVGEEEAVEAAMKYRLDLLNDLDRIGDAERGVAVAENNLLPDLQSTSSVRFNTNPDQRGVYKYDGERTAWSTGLALELPLDRKAERNQLRRSQVLKTQAERDYEQSKHAVILQVRQAMRRVIQQQASLQIQIANRNLAIERREAAQVRLATRGDISNRDLVEAENALLDARNRLASAQAELSLAILQFRRDTGTLRVDDEGRWTGRQTGL